MDTSSPHADALEGLVDDDNSLHHSDDHEIDEPAFSTYNGRASTWLALTREDRQTATSLDAQRAQDLAVHLYNAHALKRRADDTASWKKLREWHNKDRWLKKTSLQDSDGEGLDTFVPPRHWTAWPLPPELVPREGERAGSLDEAEGPTFQMREPSAPGQVLQELLMATTLKLAKERFQGRRSEDEDSQDEDGHEDESSERVTDREEEMSLDSPMQRARSPLKPPRKKSRSNSEDLGSRHDPSREVEMVTRESSDEQEPHLRPTISTDDEKSHRVLMPTTRHLMSRLDELLTALHTAREATLRDRAGSESATEGDTSDQLSTPKKRGRGRPRKHALPSEGETTAAEDSNIGSSPAPKKRRGRPKKEYPLLPGESEYERLVRVARLNKRAIPSPLVLSNPASPSPLPLSLPASEGETTDASQSRASSMHDSGRRSGESGLGGLRDWSEVVALAGMLGFPPEVVRRTTQRCADLFGEKMSLRTVDPAPTSDGRWDALETYKPSLIPELSIEVDNVGDETNESESEDLNEKDRRAFTISPFVCPVSDCEGAFLQPDPLRQHLREAHHYDLESTKGIMWRCNRQWQENEKVRGLLDPIYNRGWNDEREEEEPRHTDSDHEPADESEIEQSPRKKSRGRSGYESNVGYHSSSE